MVALDAKMVIRNESKGERVVDAENYFIGPGVRHHAHDRAGAGRPADRDPHSVHWANTEFYFEKVRDRPVWDFPLVNIASARVVNGGKIERIRIVGERRGRASVAPREGGRGRHRQDGERRDGGDGRAHGHGRRGAAALQRLQSAVDEKSREARDSRRFSPHVMRGTANFLPFSC
jgi:hypothetical protein